MVLSFLKRGQKAKIVKINHPILRMEAVRFGIHVGQWIECYEVIPAGPIIIKKQNIEIAVGRKLANAIEVSSL
ncbi:FeoA family protein [Alkalihalobacterium bogoriense]|uniref:FeoA family protein n=1 Tax=Alkalihalobacterium bogoriense TaxID=246272 RepID=UPI00047BF591|nr:ferrous iron transport protein A [Alkalihalobacterium bogoriense]